MGEATQGLRILHVTQGFPPEFIGGTELYCAVLVAALRERGHSCFVLAGSNEQVAGPAALVTTDEGGVCVTRCKSAFSPVWREQQIDPYNPEAELLIRRHFATVRPDVVHVHHWLRLTNNIVALAAEAGIPVVVTLHDLWASCARLHRQHRLGHFCQEPPSASVCVGCVERLPEQEDAEVQRAIELRQEQIAGELALARSVLVPSEAHRQFLSRMMNMPAERLRVLPHGSVVRLLPRADKEDHGFPGRPLRLGYWGYLVHHKGVHLLLEAVKRLKDPSAVEIFLAGLAPDTQYAKHLEELAQGLRVTFSGEYRPTDLTRLDVDIAVFPSLAYESHGFVLDEALQLGVPVIVSDRGALAGRTGDAGLAFAAGDANGLALKIQEVLDTPGLLERMRVASRSVRLSSMPSHAEALDGIYREALSAPCPRSVPSPLTASLRLSHLHATLAARDQTILGVKGDMRDQSAALDRQQALTVQRENEIRQKDQELQSQGAEIRWKDAQLSLSDKRYQEEAARVRALEAWVHKVANSAGWRVLQRFYFVREHLVAPPGSRRGRLYDLLKRAGVIYADDGLAGLARKARKRLSSAGQPNPYELWLSRHRLTPEQTQHLRAEVQTLAFQPLISILMPVYNTDATCLRRALESIQSQIYPHWQLCVCDDGSTMAHVRQILESFSQHDERIKVLFSPSNQGVSAASNKALTLTRGEYVALVDHDDELMPHALSEIAKALNVRRSAVLYSDEAIIDAEGRATFIYFRPEFSPEYLTSHQYIVHMIVVRKELLERIGGWDEEFPVSQDYDLLLRLMDETTDFTRVPQVLYLWRHHDRRHSLLTKDMVADYGKRALTKHLARTAVTGDVVDTPFFNVFRIRRHVLNDRVSIIIPTRNKVELLRACIDSIERNSSYRNYEIIVVDNNSDDPATLRYLDQVSHRVVRYALAFNYSAINNLAAATATGGHFVFLNNDTEVITNEWLEVLLEQSQRKEVGVVGAKLLFGNGQVQHGGVVLGLGGQLADHAFRFADRGDAGYLSSLVSTRNYSAVTGACMMMRAEVFRELNGFDEEIQVVYSDVDLCLRVWGEGYRVVWTPHALLYHHEARTRKELTPQGDVTMFMRKWAHLVTQTDRFYHPDLSVRRFDFSLDV